jgi:RHS repeat-associated protein
MSKRTRRPTTPRRDRTRARLGIEFLEDRTLLDAANIFARFSGVLSSPTDTQRINIAINPHDFTLNQPQKLILGLQLRANGSSLDPATVQVRDSGGALVNPLYTNPDLANLTQSLSVSELNYGSYTLTVAGERGTQGAFRLDVFLAGDVNGDRTVDTTDGDLLRGIMGSVAGDGQYRVEADGNLDGQITGTDNSYWARNQGDVVRINPLGITASLSPAPIVLPGGGLLTNVPHGTLGGTTNPGVAVSLETGSDGLFDEGNTTAGASGSYSFPVTLNEGLNTLQVQAVDGFGQKRTASVTVTLDTVPPAVAVASPAPGLVTNHNVTVAGTVTDDRSGVALLQAAVDGGAYAAVAFDAAGNFHFATALPLDHTADGSHTVHLRAADRAGNVSAVTDVSFTLDTVPPTVSITAPAPGLTTDSNITVTGRVSDDRAGVASLVGAVDGGAFAPVAFDASGNFSFTTALPLDDTADGPHVVHFQATDRAGNVSSMTDLPFTLEVCPPWEQFGDWRPGQDGGSATGHGRVVIPSCHATLYEGDSFDVTLRHAITIPSAPSVLTFAYSNLAFDTSSQGRLKDAFEVALVGSDGISLVPTVAANRDAFFNVSEGQEAALGAWTRATGQTVTLDLTHVTPGTGATLIIRLVNNDGDVGTSVKVESVQVLPLTGQPAGSGGQPPAALLPAAATIDFTRLTDVTASLQSVYGRTSYDEAPHVLYAGLAARNAGQYPVNAPLVAVINHLSDPSVRVRGADGLTPDGRPYYDFSSLVGGGKLAAGAATGSRTLSFYDPNGVPFTYDVVFVGQLNRPPVFTTTPNTEALVGHPYAYSAAASDPDGDPLTFSLAVGPTGMAVDATTGRVTWAPAPGNLGNQAVALRVTDGRGGSAEQDFTLAAIQPPPNRPPVFTSSPGVSANVNTAYQYQATATDPDQDSLTFALAGGPQGMTVDSASGLVQWQPTASQLGLQHVALTVSDGRGGSATQTYTIDVQQQPGNRPPVFISTPTTQFDLPAVSNPASGTVSPTRLDLTLAPGATTTQTVSVTLPSGGGAQNVGVFHVGDVFASIGHGFVAQFAPDGTLLRVLDSQILATGTGMAFDAAANLYVTEFDTSNIARFSANGLVTAPNPFVVDDFGAHNESIVFDAAGNFYVGQADSPKNVLKRAPDGTLLARYQVQTEDRGSDWVDLASDQHTLYYTSEGDTIFRFDTATNRQLPNFAALPGSNGEAFALRILPDGGVLVADTSVVIRLNSSGQIVREYGRGLAVNDIFFAMNLDPDGSSFWTATFLGGKIYHFDMATGALLGAFQAPLYLYLGGLAVFGESTAALSNVNVVATDPSVQFVNQTGPVSGVSPGQIASFTVRFTGDGAAHSFDLRFVRAGTGNVLGSIPVTLNGHYLYLAKAIDPDGDPVSYRLLTAPPGATLDPVSGRLDWQPSQAGVYHLSVAASDGRGGQSTQDFDITVKVAAPSQPPVISSQPGLAATVGRPYEYAVQATDPNGYRLSYYLLSAPAGMTIDPNSGVLTWTPTSGQVGGQPVQLEVLNQIGGVARQPFTITVAAAFQDHPPFFTSTAPTDALVGDPLRYPATATSPDSAPLQFDLVVKPAGMTVDASTGVVVWTPTADQVGPQSVVLRVQDGQEGVALQPFTLTVRLPSPPPVITSTPPGPATANLPYQYQVRAVSASGLALSYRLATAPAGMTIDANTGLIRWTPTAGQVGTNPVAVVVTDSSGQSATRPFNLQVVSAGANRFPTISSTPPTVVGLGRTYRYAVQADDPDGDPLTYRLLTAPAGMTIDAGGLITWAPTAAQFGPNSVLVEVSDGRGGLADQPFTVQVGTQPSSHPPSITSTPPQAATVGAQYSYDATGTDPDGTPLVWSLDAAPAGMAIDPTRGMIRWTPTADELGSQNVVLRLTNGEGQSVTQSFTVTVRLIDVPPDITSEPPTQAGVGQAYSYAVRASDVDGDPLTFSLTAGPAGMTIDPTTGLIRWTPTSAQVGTQSAEVLVTDGRGGAAVQDWAVVVSATAIPLPPTITSTPTFAGAVGQAYSYPVTATDPQAQPLTYSLGQAPAGMTIDPTGGLVQWTPGAAQTGPQAVRVVATNQSGLSAYQTFSVQVLVNHAPVINSVAGATGTVGLRYAYDVRATDADGDPLTYTLTAGPAGMTLDALGRLRWLPGTPDIGTAHVSLTVADNRGASAGQSFDVTVGADTQTPSVQLSVSPNPAALGTQVTFVVNATDNVGVTALSLTVGGTHVGLDASGRATLTMSHAGDVSIVATATDAAGNVGTASSTLSVIDPSVTNPPTVSIDTPAAGTVLTAATDVIGTVSDSSLLYYTLSIAPAGSNTFTEIARGTSPVSHGVLGRFDPSLLSNDSYDLRLYAKNTGGLDSTIDETLSVTGGLKLGNFRLSFTDLSIPVAGIPITVTRTYDSLDAANPENFGFGWRMEFRDTELHTSVPKTGDEADLIYNSFQDRTRVYVTLPGGKREGFTFHPTLAPGFRGSFLGIYVPSFTPDAGVTDQLTVPSFNLAVSTDGTVSSYGDGLPYNPASPLFAGYYVLTTKDGLAYQIDGNTGSLRQVTDANSNTLTFSDAGIVSSAGPQVTFARDPQGRITALTDPAGKTVSYQYDAAGNLVAVTDRQGNTTQLVYGSPRPHYLTQVIDPLGHTGVRTDYDDQGRLITLTDAAGKSVHVSYDPTHSIETVTDQLGNPTTYEYDDRGNIVTETDALGGVTRRTYDAANNQVSETDPLGRITTDIYDARGNVLTEIDPLGNVTRHTYQTIPLFSNLNVPLLPLILEATTTDPLGNTTTNNYDGQGNLLSTADALGHSTSFAYGAGGNPTSLTDANGNTTSFAYDGAGHLLQQTDALGNLTVYTYDANGNRLTETRTLTTPAGPRTLVTTYGYDANGRVTSVTDPEGGITRTEYDAAGNRTATVDALGRRTEYRYDDRGELIATIYPDATPNDLSDNPTTRSEYDAAGHKTADVDEAGRRTTYKYDALGRLVETDFPDATPNDPTDNPHTRVEFDAAGQVTARIDERGNRTEFTYDGAGRQIVIKDALGHITVSAYDTAGRLVATTDPLGHTTSFVLDAAGRTVETDYADGTKSSVAFDAAGRVAARTDQAGKTTRYEYDALGRLTAVVDALGQRTQYTYDEAGDLVSQSDADSHVTHYEYDGLGRRTATVLPLGQRSTTAYDAAGEVTSTTDFNGTTISYQYDSRGRLTSEGFPDGSSVAFVYTVTGQRQTVTDNRGTAQYAYDARDRLLSRTDPDGTQVSYTYDVASNRTSVTTPAGTTLYTFDVLNRVATVTDPGGSNTLYTYDAGGNLTHTTLPNGTSETRSYDSLNRLVILENDGPSGVISSYRYTLDADGNRTQVVEDTGRTVRYAYDALFRLIGETITDPVNGNRSIGYTYDAVGNRLTRNDSGEGLTSYTYDANDRLLTESLAGQVTQYSYDNNGNTLSRVKSAIDQVFYHWDAQNRLIGADVTDASGTHHTDYRYDADGVRVSQTQAGQETRYLIDTVQPYAQVLLEYRPSGLIVASYVYGNGLIEQNRGGATSYYQKDGLGSTRALTNASGVVTDRYTYDAFGRLIGQMGSTVNSYLFAGQQRDTATGLDYLRARYLNPAAGRFVSKDPLSGSLNNPISRNGYVYASLNPALRTDPSGNQDSLLEVGVALGIISDLQIIASIALVKGGISGKLHWDAILATVKLSEGTGSPVLSLSFGADILLAISEPLASGQRVGVETLIGFFGASFGTPNFLPSSPLEVSFTTGKLVSPAVFVGLHIPKTTFVGFSLFSSAGITSGFFGLSATIANIGFSSGNFSGPSLGSFSNLLSASVDVSTGYNIPIVAIYKDSFPRFESFITWWDWFTS